MKEKKKRLIIIDANSLIHRAYHALPPLISKKEGLVNAVYGFLLVFFKALREFQPDFVVTAFDLPGPTFRHREFKEYKATRPKTPEELSKQIQKTKEVIQAFNIPIFEKEGFEADDIIGTIASKASGIRENEIETIILSGDADALQLVDEKTRVYALKKGIKDVFLYTKEEVREKYDGLDPEQLLDLKALRGDPSDNIPGVNGIGEKTATQLIKEFGSLEELYRHIENNSQKAQELRPKIREKLIEEKERAYLSKNLARIKKDVPLEFNLKECRWATYEKTKVVQTLEDFEFNSLIKRLPEIKKEDVEKKELHLW